MGQIRNGPPPGLVSALQRQLQLDEFIETGTHMGNTTEWASKSFSKVTTVELSPEFHQRAEIRFRARDKIRCLCGDSATVLSKIVPTLEKPALFWLDAHWSGADTAGSVDQCPVLRELEVIDQSRLEHVVLVDDARLFCAPPPAPQQPEKWPSLSKIIEALNPARRYIVLYEDVFVAVPISARHFLNTTVQVEFEKNGRLRRFLPWRRR